MECNEIREMTVDYFEKNINAATEEKIQRHLEECGECREQYEQYKRTVNSVRRAFEAERRGIAVDSAFEGWMQDALKNAERESPKEKSLRLNMRLKWKLSIAASVVVVMIAVFAFTPVMAALKEGISTLVGLAMGDRGIISSMEKGFGQTIEKTDSDKGIEFTVHSFLTDENRSVALVSASYTGKLEQKADNITLYGMDIANKAGKAVSRSYSSRFVFDAVAAKISGNIDLGDRKQDGKDIVISFDAAVISKQEKLEIPIELTGKSLLDINHVIELNTSVIRRVTLKNIIINGNKLTIDYDIEYQDEIFMTGGHIISLISGGANHFYSLGSASSRKDDTRVESIQDSYEIDSLDLKDCKLQLEYAYPIKTIKGNWKVSFRPDESLAKASTRTITPNKSFMLDGCEFKISKAVFTPSLTTVHIESKEINPLIMLGRLSLVADGRIINDSSSGTATASMNLSKQEMYSAFFSFDPVYPEDELDLFIQSARTARRINEEVRLDLSQESTQRALLLDGVEYLLKYRLISQDFLEIGLERNGSLNAGETEIPFGQLYITGLENKKLLPMDNNSRLFNISGVQKESLTLHIDSIIKMRDVSLVVPLID